MWHLKTRRPKQWVRAPPEWIVRRGREKKGNESRHSENNKKRNEGIKRIQHRIRTKGRKVQQQSQAKTDDTPHRTALCLPRFLSIMLYRFVLSSPFDNKSSAFETVFLSSFQRSVRSIAWLAVWLCASILALGRITLNIAFSLSHTCSLAHSLLKSESNGFKIDVNPMTSTIYVQFRGNAVRAVLLYSLIECCFVACLTLYMKFNFLQKTNKGETKGTYAQPNTKRQK